MTADRSRELDKRAAWPDRRAAASYRSDKSTEGPGSKRQKGLHGTIVTAQNFCLPKVWVTLGSR